MPATKEAPQEQLTNFPQPYEPANIATHEADKARRAAERLAKKPLLDDCLEPEFAANAEAMKPNYEWEVSATFKRKLPDGRGVERMQTVERKEKVRAHNELDAWAKFCDKIGFRVSPREGTRSIKQLKRVNGN